MVTSIDTTRLKAVIATLEQAKVTHKTMTHLARVAGMNLLVEVTAGEPAKIDAVIDHLKTLIEYIHAERANKMLLERIHARPVDNL